ncbi:UPF0057 membrane protein At2g24040-like [Hordeum vulgare subsp. vulgare]|uniref:Uncharacterized protein n=1 Tax=Hordeum vulgare subsp. vulgare TaxID=112509 RepID=A0A8I6Y9W7_HORVV|nr:UPF0057 membrane protein At2g24040-like [Hordeum vulgare subsp. vulgare]
MTLGSWCRRCPELLCVVVLPPLGVYLRHGCYTMGFWISVLLTILGYLLFFLEAHFFMGYALCVVYAVWFLVHVYRDGLPHNGDDYDDDDDEPTGATANLSYVFVA